MKTLHQKLKKNAFTLVEIVLALMVAAVGIIGVMALFPVGLTKNKQTVQTRSAADAADQFLHSMAARIRADWNVVDAFPDTLPTRSEDGIVWSQETLLQNSNVSINFSAVNAGDTFNPSVNKDGVFKVTQITPSNIVDFKGVIRSWRELTEVGDSRMTGDIVPFALTDLSSGADPKGFGYINGNEYILKESAQGGIAGNYGALALGGTGAATYRTNIVNGFGAVSVGAVVSSETGNMAGPTADGVSARIAATPYVRVLVVTPFGNGHSDVTVLGFLPFKLLSCTGGNGNNAAEIRAIYIGPDATGAGVGTSSFKLNLKAEVSWPQDIPYAARQKEIFSVKLYKGGTIASIGE